MRAGRHRDPFFRDIDVITKACRINRRESPLHELCPQVGDVKIDMTRFRRRHLRQDCPRHDVSRRQRPQWVVPLHEQGPFIITQLRTLSSHRFRQQERRTRRQI